MYWRVSQVAAMKRQASVLGARRLGRAKGAVVRNPWRLTTSFRPRRQAGARRTLFFVHTTFVERGTPFRPPGQACVSRCPRSRVRRCDFQSDRP